jgi:hypothetical protein
MVYETVLLGIRCAMVGGLVGLWCALQSVVIGFCNEVCNEGCNHGKNR